MTNTLECIAVPPARIVAIPLAPSKRGHTNLAAVLHYSYTLYADCVSVCPMTLARTALPISSELERSVMDQNNSKHHIALTGANFTRI